MGAPEIPVVDTCFHGRHISPKILAGLTPDGWGLKDYQSRGGYEALRKILESGLTPEQVVAEIKHPAYAGGAGLGFRPA